MGRDRMVEHSVFMQPLEAGATLSESAVRHLRWLRSSGVAHGAGIHRASVAVIRRSCAKRRRVGEENVIFFVDTMELSLSHKSE